MDEKVYPKIHKTLKLRCNKIDETKKYFIKETHEIEVMSSRLNKYITAFDYVASSFVTITSFATAIGVPLGKASASINLVFSFGNKYAKIFLKQ